MRRSLHIVQTTSHCCSALRLEFFLLLMDTYFAPSVGPVTSIVCCAPAPSRLGTVTFRTPENARSQSRCVHSIGPATLLTKQCHGSALTVVIGSCDLAGVSAIGQADLQAVHQFQ